MVRIDVSDPVAKRRFACPSPLRHRQWRVVDGWFECRSCGETYRALVDLTTGERVTREDTEIVGTGADHQGAFGEPTVEEE